MLCKEHLLSQITKKKEVKAPPPQVDLLAIASLQCFCIFFQGGFSGKENLFFMIC
jgi:hypothetical protein